MDEEDLEALFGRACGFVDLDFPKDMVWVMFFMYGQVIGFPIPLPHLYPNVRGGEQMKLIWVILGAFKRLRKKDPVTFWLTIFNLIVPLSILIMTLLKHWNLR